MSAMKCCNWGLWFTSYALLFYLSQAWRYSTLSKKADVTKALAQRQPYIARVLVWAGTAVRAGLGAGSRF